jgi:hypothetical protein
MARSKLSRVAIVSTFSALVALAASPASAAFSAAEIKCRDTIAKQGSKLAQQASRALNACHEKRVEGTEPPTTDCNSTVEADFKGKVQKAADKLLDSVPDKCEGLTPSALNYDGCPFPCDAVVPAIADFNNVAACIECTTRTWVESMTGSAQGNPALSLDDPTARCHDALGTNQTKHFLTIVKERRKCQKTAEKGGAMDVTSCVNADPKGKIAKTRAKVDAAVGPACQGATLATMDSCAEITLEAVESCVFDDSAASSAAYGRTVFRSFYELTPGGGSTTTTFNGSTTSTTTTTLGGGAQDPQCPNQAELVLYAGTRGVSCSSNTDCGGIGECNVGIGRCTTTSELDTGYTGIAHDADIVDEALTLADIVCPGPAPTCGECTVAGINPEPGYCRCANDNRTICDQPFAADANDCGGDLCNCYFGVPLALSSGNTPACVVNRFREDISGTVNVDLGDGENSVRLASVVYLGDSTIEPCPTCGGTCTAPPANVGDTCTLDLHCDTVLGDGDGVCGNLDPTPNDGIRGGTCRGGLNAGQTCDAGARHESFPAPGGGSHSLDCFPDPGVNVSGAGLRIDIDQTTAQSSLTAALPCGPGNAFLCHCSRCSGNAALTCTSNADCTGAGNCTVISPVVPFKNSCASDNICNDAGGGEGVCNLGPTDGSCDGIVRANGEGFLSCSSNSDCASFPGGLGGDCTLTKPRECFLETIVAEGLADPEFPIGAGIFCIAQTSNGAINSVAGLPGPGRVVNQGSVVYYCASNQAVTYTPGVGGCP